MPRSKFTLCTQIKCPLNKNLVFIRKKYLGQNVTKGRLLSSMGRSLTPLIQYIYEINTEITCLLSYNNNSIL